MSKGYIACCHFEETIYHFGAASTPEGAILDFLTRKQFNFHEYCWSVGLQAGEQVTIKVFEALDPGLNTDWSWTLGKEVWEGTAPVPGDKPVRFCKGQS